MNTKVLIKNKDLIYEIPEYMKDEVDTARHMLMETCAEFNDELLEKYLEGEEITETEVAAALIEGIVNAKIFPVLCGSATKGIGFRQLMNSIIEYMPTPYFRASMGINPKIMNSLNAVQKMLSPDMYLKQLLTSSSAELVT